MSTLKDIIQRALGGEELKVASVETAPVAVVVTASETEKLAESLEYLALNLHAIEAPEAIKAAHFHNFLMKVAEDAVVQQSAMQDALDPTVIPNDYGVDITGGEAAPIPVAMSNTVLPEFIPLVAPPGDMSPTAIPTDDAAPGFIPEADPGKVANYIFQKMAQEEAAAQNLPGYGRGILRGAGKGALTGAGLGALAGGSYALGSLGQSALIPGVHNPMLDLAALGGAGALTGALAGTGVGALKGGIRTALQRRAIAKQEAAKQAAYEFAKLAEEEAAAQNLPGYGRNALRGAAIGALAGGIPSAALGAIGGHGLSGSFPEGNFTPTRGALLGGAATGLPGAAIGAGLGALGSLGVTAIQRKRAVNRIAQQEAAKEAGVGRVYEMLKVASDLDNPANIIAPREEEPGLLLSSPDGLGTPAGGPFLIPEIQSNESVMGTEGLDLTEQFNNELLQYIGENGYDPTTELLLDEAAAQKTASLVKILGVL